jgi:glycosyltransferase involved in cell wall biosynthesis
VGQVSPYNCRNYGQICRIRIKKMKIAVDARTLGSRPSGVGMYLNDFLKQLMKYEDLEFVLISDVAESEYIKSFIKNGIKVYTKGKQVYKSAGVYAYFAYVKKQLDIIKPDIFWEVNTIIPINLGGSFKTMITIHDMFPIEYVEYFGQVYSMYFKYNLKKTLKNTDMILYNSEQTKSTTEEFFPEAKSIANVNAYIISNPVKDDDYFLYVGNMEKRKGVDLLIKGYLQYKNRGGKKKLILGGKMQEEEINQIVRSAMMLDEDITYLDYVTHDKKHELYASMSAFVFPSKAEGFGMPIIEVMRFKKPIIASNLPIFDEITDGNINTFNIRCNEYEQINNLADELLSYNTEVDTEAYANVVKRYAPDRLGKVVYDFITSD